MAALFLGLSSSWQPPGPPRGPGDAPRPPGRPPARAPAQDRARAPAQDRARAPARRRWLRRVPLLAGALLVAFAAGEIGVRVDTALRGKVPPHADDSVAAEWRWAREHLASGSATLEGDGVFDPQLGWVTRPNLSREGVHTNAAGIRARREFSREKPPGTRRIVLVGDSYTFGFNVADEDAFASVLQGRWLPGWEVLNLGVSGYGVDQAVRLAETTGLDYHPDVTVLGFFVRDFYRNLDSFRGYRKPRFVLDDRGELHLEGVPVRPPQELYEDYATGRKRIGGWGMSYLLAKITSHLRGAILRRSVGPAAPSWKLMASLLRRFRDRMRQAGCEPFLLVIPERLERHLGTGWERLDRLAVEEAARLGMPCRSLTGAFQRALETTPSDPLYQPAGAGGHLSVRGNAIAARELHDGLREAGLIGED